MLVLRTLEKNHALDLTRQAMNGHGELYDDADGLTSFPWSGCFYIAKPLLVSVHHRCLARSNGIISIETVEFFRLVPQFFEFSQVCSM